MRYRGQGHEIAVDLPVREMEKSDFAMLEEQFADAYSAHYGRTIPNLDVEVVSWSLALSTAEALPSSSQEQQASRPAKPVSERLVSDSETGEERRVPVYLRSRSGTGQRDFRPGDYRRR